MVYFSPLETRVSAKEVLVMGFAIKKAEGIEVTCMAPCGNCLESIDEILNNKKCVKRIWIPNRHLTDNKRNSGNIDRQSALEDFLEELGIL